MPQKDAMMLLKPPGVLQFCSSLHAAAHTDPPACTGLRLLTYSTLLQADRTRRALMKAVTGAWAMQHHLDALWRTLFLASPAMQPFLSSTYSMLAASDRDGTELMALDIQTALDMALFDAEQGSLLPSNSVTGVQLYFARDTPLCIHGLLSHQVFLED